MMKVDLSLKRMDSLMVASNIKQYTCVANLAKEVVKQGDDIPEELKHYTK